MGFTEVFHLLSHSIFLIWPHFYDKSLEKYIRLIFLLHFSSNIIFSDKILYFVPLFSNCALYFSHSCTIAFFAYSVVLHHDLKKQCLSDTSCFNSFHYNYISFNLKIRHIEKGILHSVNLNEMIPNFHVNRTWFYNTNYTLFFEKCKQIFILHTR